MPVHRQGDAPSAAGKALGRNTHNSTRGKKKKKTPMERLAVILLQRGEERGGF